MFKEVRQQFQRSVTGKAPGIRQTCGGVKGCRRACIDLRLQGVGVEQDDGQTFVQGQGSAVQKGKDFLPAAEQNLHGL